MSSTEITYSSGFFGKIPSHGDFVARRLPRSFVTAWENWLNRCLYYSRGQLGDSWPELYRTSPIWRFVLASDICGTMAWAGVLMPSVDKANRYFPLTFALELPSGTNVINTLMTSDDWFTKAERLALSTLEDEISVDELDAELVRIDKPGLHSVSGGSNLPPDITQRTRERMWCFELNDVRQIPDQCPALAGNLLLQLMPRHSLWQTGGSQHIPGSLITCDGLPFPQGFSALLDGRWQHWGWGYTPANYQDIAVDGLQAGNQPKIQKSIKKWQSRHLSDVGCIRRVNEDAYLDWPEMGLWVVADGMGGYEGGALASHQIVECLREVITPRDLDDFIQQVRNRLLEANSVLRRLVANSMGRDIVGSTVVVLLAFDSQCACLWAGDSRLYLFRGEKLRPLTRDHSVVEELVSSGAITPEDAAQHPQENMVTRAIGGADELEIDIITIEIEPDDLLVLCSDGLTKELSDDEIAEILAGTDQDLACEYLVKRAITKGGRDNVTVVTVCAS